MSDDDVCPIGQRWGPLVWIPLPRVDRGVGNQMPSPGVYGVKKERPRWKIASDIGHGCS